MQYVGKVGDYVYNQWNSLNPATLSGAIDIIVIEQPDGTLHSSPWHVRFGKFQIIKPLQKKIDLYVNDIKTDLPMKLGEGGEAFFVFETDASDLSLKMVTSPVVSAENSPGLSPLTSPRGTFIGGDGVLTSYEPDELDLNAGKRLTAEELEQTIKLDNSPPPSLKSAMPSQDSRNSTQTLILRLAFEKAKRITQQLNIPSKIDVNGDMVLDMDGYKPNSQKNIDESDELVHKIFLEEMNSLLNGKEPPFDSDDEQRTDHEYSLLQSVITKDKDGRIRIINKNPDGTSDSDLLDSDNLTFPIDESEIPGLKPLDDLENRKTYFKTLRLTSEQLLSMGLHYGKNQLKFKLTSGTSQIVSDLYLWKSTTPIVISDIDGTITKSDALGHVLNMIGRDWTHTGVAKLFQDIKMNGYNILYLTARSVGQADTTRQYLDSIVQDGVKLPKGPVILSPDRTMAALRREIILKKPEVFKMACLRDIKSLFFSKQSRFPEDDVDDERTPFYAGFGNRITDAISYRSVKIPPHRIFTINPNGEVHMELLELAGYKSSYLHIGELVDQFFPPLKFISAFNNYWNEDQLNQYMEKKDRDHETMPTPGSPRSINTPGSPRSIASYPDEHIYRADEKYTDLNFWREPMTVMSDLSDLEDDDAEPESLRSSSNSPKIRAMSTAESPISAIEAKKELNTDKLTHKKERPISSTFASPLKSFMMRGSSNTPEPKALNIPLGNTTGSLQDGEDEFDDYTDDDDDDYDDYTDGDEDDDDEEDDDDDEEDDDEEDDDEEDEIDDDDDDDDDDEGEFVDMEEDKSAEEGADGAELEFDDDDIDEDDALPTASSLQVHASGSFAASDGTDVIITKASDMLKKLNI